MKESNLKTLCVFCAAILTACLLASLAATIVFAADKAEPEYDWNLLANDFSSSADYDTSGNANSGVKGTAFVKQAATEDTKIVSEDGLSFVRIASQTSGNTQLVGTFLNTSDALQVSDKSNSAVNLVMRVRFRVAAGNEGIHFRFGSSAYRTVIEMFINGAGNMCVKGSGNVIAESVNDGEWHVLTAKLKYDSGNDVFEADVDGGTKYSGSASGLFSRTDAPIMTVLLLKEANKGYSDIDYVYVSDGTLKNVEAPVSEPQGTEPPTTETSESAVTTGIQSETTEKPPVKLTYKWDLLNIGFSKSSDYVAEGDANSGLKTSAFIRQNGDGIKLMKSGGVTFIRIPSLESGNALLAANFLDAVEAKDVSDKSKSKLDLVMQVRFRAPAGSKGVHFRFGGSAYRTVVDVFINGAGNLCVKGSGNVIAGGVNDGQWHVLTVRISYSGRNDLFEAILDEGEAYTGKLSDLFSRTDAPVMSVLLLKEPGSEAVDIDYVKVSSGKMTSADTADVTIAVAVICTVVSVTVAAASKIQIRRKTSKKGV